MQNSSVLLVGTISNVEHCIQLELQRVLNSLQLFKSVEIFLVESDSDDGTLNKLEKLKDILPNLNYVSLGQVRDRIPNRIERIRYSRNRYVKYIREYSDHDFVVVADLDGMNTAINQFAVSSCFGVEFEWNACFANQSNGYYDLYALRAKGWLEQDCFHELEVLKSARGTIRNSNAHWWNSVREILYQDDLRQIAIYDNMKIIPIESPWIPVTSAFGGLGIYKRKLFDSSDYTKLNLEPCIYSEHVDFHHSCVALGYSLYINPRLINSHWNTYNRNRIKMLRLARNVTRRSKTISRLIRAVKKLSL